jgi:predicted component of type VI protein secretion system
MTPQLVALTDGPNIPLSKPILLVGRHQECDIQIPSRKISRRHCCVAQVGKTLVVRDLGSTNGIRVNGERLPEGQLQDGDELTIGNIRYQFRLTDEPPAHARSKSPDPVADSDDHSLPIQETGGNIPAPREKRDRSPKNSDSSALYRADQIGLLPLDTPSKHPPA